MPRYRGGLDVITELLLAEEHTPIEHMSPGIVKGDDVVRFDHAKRVKFERYPRYKRHVSQGHFQIFMCITTSIQPKNTTSIFLPSPIMKKFSSGPGTL